MHFANPHNPTGRVWSEEELATLGQIMKENDVWLISDEIHCDIKRSVNHISHLPKLSRITTKSLQLCLKVKPSTLQV